MVTICTASLTFNNSTFCPHSVFMCFVWISEQTAIISLYNINWLVFITNRKCVYCAVRTENLYIHLSSLYLKGSTQTLNWTSQTAEGVLAVILPYKFLSLISPANKQNIQNPTTLSWTYTQCYIISPRNCVSARITDCDSIGELVCIIWDIPLYQQKAFLRHCWNI